jgi:pSer/pThr/pTyr-binding forkhead associated (FHA) protein
VAYVFCNQCGHRNPPGAAFCSSCGTVLDRLADRTIVLAKVDPLLDAPGASDDVVVSLNDLPVDAASLVVRTGEQVGASLPLDQALVRLGRSPDSEIPLDDITVSRRHAEIRRDGDRYVVSDVGSLNGTYVNQQRIDDPVELQHGDELQVGKFRLVFFGKTNG